MLTYSAHPHPDPDEAEDGLWLLAYTIPGTSVLSVVMAGMTERAARTEAAARNRDGAAADALSLELAATHPADRKIPKGFYSDGEAQ